MEHANRWYDKDPRISLAVGCLQNATPLARKRIARAIIRKVKSQNIEAQEFHLGFFRRWYDESRALSMAMEYFRISPPFLQRAIAEYIISKLTIKPAK